MGNLASRVYPIPGFPGLMILSVEGDGRLQPLNSLFYVLVDIYSNARQLLSCLGELPEDRPPPVADILVEAFAVRCDIRSVAQTDHLRYLGEVPLIDWQLIP